MNSIATIPNDYQAITSQITSFIKEQAPAGGVVIGISGGIDSAIVMGLSVKALGADKVTGLLMPQTENDISPVIKEYVQQLGIHHEILPIGPIVDAYRQYGHIADDKVVAGNIKARIRMSLLYSRSNASNLVVMGTGNRSELLAGYFTKYGDGGVDYLPIGDLYKTQVRGVAKHIGVPEPIILQPPSAGLWDGQTDEAELGVSYDTLDAILFAHTDQNIPFDQINLPGVTKAEIAIVKDRVEKNSFKLALPKLCQIRK